MSVDPVFSAALCILGVNLLTFLVYGLDKLLARRGKHRVPEASLLTLSFLCGSEGAMLAMVILNHKTNAREHPGFVWGVPMMFLLQLALGVWLIWRRSWG